MTMLASLKALLFSSTAPGAAASKGTALPGSAAGVQDFAALLSGSMAETAPAQTLPGLGQAVGAGVAIAETSEIVPGDKSVGRPPHEVIPSDLPARHPVSHGLAVAVAAGKAPGIALSMPPGLALGLAKRAAAPEPAEGVSADPTAPGVIQEAAAPVVDEMVEEAPKPLSEIKAEPVKAGKTARPAPAAEASVAVPAKQEAEQVDPVEPISDEQDEVKSTTAEEVPPPLVAYSPLVNMTPAPADVVAPVPEARPSITSSPLRAPVEAMRPMEQQADVPALPTADQPVEPVPAKASAAAPLADVVVPTPVPAASSAKLSSVRIAAMATAETPPAIRTASTASAEASALVPPDQEAAIAPGVKPLKSDALALLQLVREQVGARTPDTPTRTGEQVAAVIGKRGQGRATAAETPVASQVPPTTTDVPQAASGPSATLPSVATPSAPTVDLSASLGAQVVDIGVSGQWIDGLARDIAGLSAHGAQGRFQINADQLGPVQVDIRQGSEGAAVHLTVASEAAEMALRQDSDRLKLDAGLSAVRIAEVKIDRAPQVTEAARADTAGQQSSQQQPSSQGSAAWANNNQNMGQSQGQQGRWQSRENNGFTPKSSSDPAVLNHAEARQDARESRRARYA